jgi:hypothetical protein
MSDGLSVCFIYLSVYVYQSTYLYIYLSAHQCVDLSICHPSICRSIYLSFHISVYPSVNQSQPLIDLLVCVPVRLPKYMSSIYLLNLPEQKVKIKTQILKYYICCFSFIYWSVHLSTNSSVDRSVCLNHPPTHPPFIVSATMALTFLKLLWSFDLEIFCWKNPIDVKKILESNFVATKKFFSSPYLSSNWIR